MTKKEFAARLRTLVIETTNKYGYVDITEKAMLEIAEKLQDLITFDEEVIENAQDQA